MPALSNPKYEAFAQHLAAHKTADEAYGLAGYKPSRNNAARLKSNEGVKKRVAELVAAAAQKAEIDIERVIREMARLSFADIRQVIRWGKKTAEDGTVSFDVDLIDSASLSDDTAAAIAEVIRGKDGTLRVKMHNKQAALESLAKQLERGKGADLVVEEKQAEQPVAGPGVIDARQAFKRFGQRKAG